MPQRVLAGAMLGMESVGSTPPQFDAFLRAGIQYWAEAVKESGVRGD
jgi:hypothetical protein